MQIAFLPAAAKQFAALPKQDRTAIRTRLEAIAAAPKAQHGASVKPLKGEPKGRFRVRHGNYRAIYMMMADGIVVVAVGHRKEIYE
ncbi:type II toxin-antitoxin system RelE/ParE family toxin [Roseomonas hellenica]|uniref:Type II toxin-antitoxin system RelE/ParE family toxin n=1 Tax=Plastoroseomonas hellenica TaxID=2687306 RepID=A0ABS5ESN5_9PROT|nr:type II toxin-antitoxin system RelE/ParE family toxin [Plastoroseomonas hellenica]MBR0663263.1 type II toxin-antitoxin system RelE/ParE family toxin [Plastoroseomonas hellenica]